jgi:hypothetical protein
MNVEYFDGSSWSVMCSAIIKLTTGLKPVVCRALEVPFRLKPASSRPAQAG